MALFIALVVAGMALAGVRMLQVKVLLINIPQFTQVMRKLLIAGNFDRSIKLCNAVPRAPFPRAVKALLQDAKERNSRSAPTLRAALPETLDAEYKKLNQYAWLGSLGVLLAVAGAALSLAEPDAPLFLPFGAVIALGLTFGANRHVKMHREQAERCGGEIIDSYVDNIVDKAG